MKQKKAWIFARMAAALVLLAAFTSNTNARSIDIRTPLKIVQLGDSYSAGNGARDENGKRDYYEVPGCDRSKHNWGNLYVDALNAQGAYDIQYINRACSGAKTENIVDDDQFLGNELKWLGKCPTAKNPGLEYYLDNATFTCSHYAVKQIGAIDDSVDLVLMTLGGNDLDFALIVKDCFSFLSAPTPCKRDINAAMGRVKDGTLKASLITIFEQIKDPKIGKLRPGAKIVYVAYPYLSLDLSYLSGSYLLELREPRTRRLVDRYEPLKDLKELSDLGQQAQREAVDQVNANAKAKGNEEYVIFYDGTKALFNTHEPHPQLSQENPNRWLKEFEGNPFDSLTRSEWYHPNPLGHVNLAQALFANGTFGVVGQISTHPADIDVAFVVDTTGSMGNEIAQVRADLSKLVKQLQDTTDTYRVAVVSYRDYPERTGASGDYAAKVIQPFTSDLATIQAAIDSLTLGNGGDDPETVFSGLRAAIDLDWRAGVNKIAIVIGDAPALSPEPISNYTAEDIIARSQAVDPVQVIALDAGSLDSNGVLSQIAAGTGGSVTRGTSDLTTKIAEILGQAAKQPIAWLGTGYVGQIGQPVTFDASGSYDPSGAPLTLYEWDFDGDGVYDLQTPTPTATHIYDAAFDGLVGLRVTGQGGSALATAPTIINAEGYVALPDEVPCALDANGYSIILDPDGNVINCTADQLPAEHIPGVTDQIGSALEYQFQFYIPLIDR